MSDLKIEEIEVACRFLLFSLDSELPEFIIRNAYIIPVFLELLFSCWSNVFVPFPFLVPGASHTRVMVPLLGVYFPRFYQNISKTL